jgi:hypothetical protein
MASYVGNKPLFGNFDKLDDISSSFNGSANTFAMTSNSRGVTAGDETQVVISLNGVIQEPVTDYFLATTGQIQFTTAPASGTAFFGYVTGNIGGTASTITDGIVTTSKLANTAGTGSAVQLAANTTALYITSNGRIGIGTSNPLYNVHVEGAYYSRASTTDTPQFYAQTTGGGGFWIQASDVTVSNPTWQHRSNSSEDQSFVIGGSEKMRITSAGRLSIGGNTAPVRLVELSSTTGGTIIHMTDDATGHTATDGVDIQQEGTLFQILNREAGDVRLGTNGTNALTINSSQNVGIGDTNPETVLHVSKPSTSTSVNKDADGIADPTIVIENLSDTAGNYSGVQFSASGSSITDTVASSAIYGFHEGRGGTYPYGYMAFYTTNTAGSHAEAMRIDNSGNLLVGTTNTLPAINNVEGIALSAGTFGGRLEVSRDNSEPVSINRITSDGSLVSFKKDSTTVGSIDTRGGVALTLNSQSGNGRLAQGGTAYYEWNTTRLSPVTDTVGDLGRSVQRWKDLYLSGGVYLGGTGSSNLIEDYEVGYWFPYLAGSTSGTITGFIERLGWYVKVGGVCHAHFYLANPGTNSGLSGQTKIMGLPFTSKANSSQGYGTNYYSNGVIAYNRGISHVGSYLSWDIQNNNDYGRLRAHYTNGTESVAISLSSVATNLLLRGGISYQVN